MADHRLHGHAGAERHPLTTMNEFRIYVQGYDDGSAITWRTLGELLRAGISPETLKFLIESQQSDR
jgi:hypothetical protein